MGTRGSRQKPQFHTGGREYLPNSPVSTTTGNTRSCASVVNCPLNFFALAAVSPAVAVAVAVAMMYDLIARNQRREQAESRGDMRGREALRGRRRSVAGTSRNRVFAPDQNQGAAGSCARTTKAKHHLEGLLDVTVGVRRRAGVNSMARMLLQCIATQAMRAALIRPGISTSSGLAGGVQHVALSSAVSTCRYVVSQERIMRSVGLARCGVRGRFHACGSRI